MPFSKFLLKNLSSKFFNEYSCLEKLEGKDSIGFPEILKCKMFNTCIKKSEKLFQVQQKQFPLKF